MAVFDAARANASGDTSVRLATLRRDVCAAYTSYAGSGAASDLTPVLAKADALNAAALRRNYPKIRSGVEKEVGARLLSRSRKCCLCGHAPSAQLDHHLPKTTFPEFSVLTFNLIPVCADCNFKKRELYRRSDGGPAFLHAYRDPLPTTEAFLVADISISVTVAADFRVVQTPSIADPAFATLQHHFESLDLADLYGELATELMGEKLTPIYEYYDEGGAGLVQRYLQRDALGALRRHGLNHWKRVLLDALADDTDFCDGGFTHLGDREELPLSGH
ncbi:hypothetical protein [Microlunatus endophyticus]|nr:hypothetical protein [Microlunatus endophyticus]